MATDYYDLSEQGRRNRLRGVAAAALEEYELDVVRMRGLTDATNGMFRLDTSDGSRYAMRVGLGPPAGHTALEFRSEMEWVHALAAGSDVIVPTPVPKRLGGYVALAGAADVPHERPCAVFSWLEGPLLADRLSPASVGEFGATMARMHVAAAAFVPSPGFTAASYDRVYPYDLPFVVFTDAGDDLLPAERRAAFEEAYALVERTIGRLASREPARVLHGDFHPWNAKVNRGVVSAFDFEDMVWGWPVQDIGTSLYYFWSGEDFEERRAQFRSGYESIARWPDPGGEVFTFIAGRTLVMANDVISQPEWFGAAPEVYERGERRIRDMLQRIAGH